MSFNPSASNTIGLEWFPHLEGVKSLDSVTANAAMLVASSTGETIDGLYLPHQWTGPGTGYGRLWADVYSLSSSPVAGSVTELTFSPNEDKSKSGVTRSDFGTTTNLYSVLDDTDDSGPPENTDYMVNSNYGGTATYRCQFNTAAISSSYRVLYVRFEIRAKGFDWSWKQPRIDLEWWNGSSQVGSKFATISPPQDYVFRTYSFGPYYLDFYNEGPWLQPEIANLDANTSRNMGFTLRYACAISRITMKVGVITENRAAVGISSRVTALPTGVQTNNPISFKTPLNVDNWSKSGGTDYLVVVRRLDDPFSATQTLTPQVAFVDSGVRNPHGQGHEYTVTLADAGAGVSAVTGPGTRAYPTVLGSSAGASSVDSQPYFDVAPQACHTSSTLKQGVNGASAQSYQRVRFLAAVASGVTPDAALSVKLKKVSDDSQVGGTGTLAVSDLSNTQIATSKGSQTYGSTTYTVYDVVVTLASNATLATSTNYYVEWSSTAASATPWYVLWLDSSASYSLTGNQTYGGSTNVATVAGTSDNEADFPVTVGSSPTAPTAISVAATTLSLPNSNSMEFARVSWTSGGALGANFSRWELERSDDGGTTWTAIAKLETESDVDFDDYEALVNVATKYRVRVVRSDGAFSDWRTQSGTTTMTSTSGVVLFTSNSDPTISTGFPVMGSQATYDLLSSSELVHMRLHDRDYQVAFKGSEDRGMQWSFDVIVHKSRAANPSTGAGVRGFDDIRDVMDADVPYVCMKTFDGERFFGSVAATAGVRTEPAHLYVAHVVFTQTQADSSAVTV